MHSRSSNGTPLFAKSCPDCGTVSIVDKRKIGKPCNPCSAIRRRNPGLYTDGKIDPLYKLFCLMKSRCECSCMENFKYYGGRGIRICPEWRENPALFIEWARTNGWQKGLEIDRIDCDGDYSPDNCQFITHRENSQKTRRIKTTPDQAREARRLLAGGASIKKAAAATGVTYMVAWHLKNSPDVWCNHAA